MPDVFEPMVLPALPASAPERSPRYSDGPAGYFQRREFLVYSGHKHFSIASLSIKLQSSSILFSFNGLAELLFKAMAESIELFHRTKLIARVAISRKKNDQGAELAIACERARPGRWLSRL